MLPLTLPPADHYQYFSHLFHGNKLLAHDQYQPIAGWDYPESDRDKFRELFLTDVSYVLDRKVLDLGCHIGFSSYISKTLGAESVHGINARQYPIDVANYAFSQLQQTDYRFEQGNLENFDFLKQVCKNKKTVILTEVIEHLRNPYAILEIITDSDIDKMIFRSTIWSDHGEPCLKYYLQSCDSAFSVYDNTREVSFGANPNLPWIEMVLYFLGWKIEYYKVDRPFNRNWFGTPGLTKFTPRTCQCVSILCTKFDKQVSKNNFEN